MPNTARGGGVSRKITSLVDRRRLKDILEELDIPEGTAKSRLNAALRRLRRELEDSHGN